jgi:hypothetical protein
MQQGRAMAAEKRFGRCQAFHKTMQKCDNLVQVIFLCAILHLLPFGYVEPARL